MKVTNFLDDKILQYETSDPREGLERHPNHVAFQVGGFQDEAKIGTHYSRGKLSHLFPAGRQIILRMLLELPQNFYEVHQASFKLLTFGTAKPYQRAGVWVAKDGYLRLQAEKSGSLLRTLWTSTRRLPVGKSFIRLLAVPSAIEGQGLLRLSVNGEKWGETRAPNILDANHVEIDRIVFGFDGAADQDAAPMSLNVLEIEVR